MTGKSRIILPKPKGINELGQQAAAAHQELPTKPIKKKINNSAYGQHIKELLGLTNNP